MAERDLHPDPTNPQRAPGQQKTSVQDNEPNRTGPTGPEKGWGQGLAGGVDTGSIEPGRTQGANGTR